MRLSQNINPRRILQDAEFPIGYRFIPTDEELALHYLKNKVLCGTVPGNVCEDIEANSFYSLSPNLLVTASVGEREWYFFIHEEENIRRMPIRKVGNGLGAWKKIGEKMIFNREGEVSAIKHRFTYFSKKNNKFQRTHWRMDEYKLPSHIFAENNVQGRIVLGKLMRGIDYNVCNDFA